MTGRLIPSDLVRAEAELVCRRVIEELRRARVPGAATLTGPAAMSGVLTKGDIDLHLRVPANDFDLAVERLRALATPANLEAWAPTLAVFDVPPALTRGIVVAPSAGLAVTPIGSVHDRRFTRCWQRLRTEPELLGTYNALKREYFGTAEYEARKSAFFDAISAG